MSPGVGLAARPPKNTGYDGRTSQGRHFDLYATRPNLIDNAEADVRLACTRAGRLRFDALASYIHVRRDGSFADTDYDVRDPYFDDLTRNGRAGFDITKATIRGHFVTAHRVTGTWRLQTIILSPGTFPYDPSLLDSCDSGVLRWTATAAHK